MPHADEVRNRARWNSDRASVAWLLSLADQAGLRRLVNQYQYALRDLPGFDLVPLESMHILLQDVGFHDEIAAGQRDALLESARKHLATMPSLTLAFHRAVVLPESLVLPAEPHSSLLDLRSLLREATAEVLGDGRLPQPPEETEKHVSLAYSTATGPAVFAVAALENTPVEPVTARIPSVSLAAVTSGHSWTDWRNLGEAAFGG